MIVLKINIIIIKVAAHLPLEIEYKQNMPTDVTLSELILNILSNAQYESIQNPSADELYLTPNMIDSTPIGGSGNPVMSGGVYDAIHTKGLSELLDVSVQDLSENDILSFNTQQNKWANKVLKTINSESLFGSGNILINQDFTKVQSLSSNINMSDVYDGVSCNNSNVMFNTSNSYTITVDSFAGHDNFFVLKNNSQSVVNITFDFTSQAISAIVGSGGTVVGSALVIPIPAGSITQLSYRVIGHDYVSYFAKTVRIKGVLVEESVLDDDAVALVFKNDSTGDLRFFDIDDAAIYPPVFSGYTIQPYVRFTRNKNSKSVVIHKSSVDRIWGEFNRYRLYCDTNSNGAFNWNVTINGTAKSGSVSWSAGDTLDSIVTQLNSGAVQTYLVFSHNVNDNFIRIVKGGYSSSVFTLSNVSNATLDDLSLYTRINGVQQTESHREWQAQTVESMFPNSGFLPANTAQYAQNGYNLSYRCGANLAKYKSYWRTNGSASYVAESSVGRMSEAGFNSLNGDGVSSHQALYDKYQGSWDNYMEAGMVQTDDTHTGGIEYQSYDNGDVQNAFLASVETMTFDGSYVRAFPAAYAAASVADSDLGAFHLPTNHEIAVFMRDDVMAKINTAFSYLSSANALSNGGYYWSVAQYSSYSSWFYYGPSGELTYYYKYSTYSARALAYLPLS
jgi:hypothetical protein